MDEMNILYITGRFPYPPLRGDQVIPYYRLKLLSKRHKITLLTFYENKKELEGLSYIKPFCRNIITVKRKTATSFYHMITGLFSKVPFQVLYFRSKQMAEKLNVLVNENEFDVIHAYMLRMSEYAKCLNKPKILDMIDSMYLYYQKRLNIERHILRKITIAELNRLSVYENDIVNKYNISVVVSEKDKQYMDSDAVLAIPLGVDPEKFKSKGELSNNKTMIFSGNMGYLPNEHAISWFMEHCYGKIKDNVPDVKIIIAGHNPSQKIKSFHDGKSIHVTGFVKSMPDILCDARLAIAPMQSGYGMHIKMLEAMACGLPVVCSTLALGTINAVNGKDVVIADTAIDISNNCVKLLNDYEIAKNIGNSARILVINEYSWESHVKKIEEVYCNVINNF